MKEYGANNPLVSVIVLTYNHQKTICKTLDSILKQNCDFEYEIIIGDDYSTDNTRMIIENYVRKFPSIIRAIFHERNLGVVNNARASLNVCRGEYITCIGDDWLNQTSKLQSQVDFLKMHSDYGVVYTDVKLYDEKSGKIYTSNKNRFSPDGFVFESLLKYNFIYAPTVMYRRDLLVYVDFDRWTQLNWNIEDYPMWLEMSNHTKFHYINEPTVVYRLFNKSLSHLPSIDSTFKLFDEIVRIQKYYCEKYNPQLQTQLSISQWRMYYMKCLELKEYKRSLDYIFKIGLPVWVQFILSTRTGFYTCRLFLRLEKWYYYLLLFSRK